MLCTFFNDSMYISQHVNVNIWCIRHVQLLIWCLNRLQKAEKQRLTSQTTRKKKSVFISIIDLKGLLRSFFFYQPSKSLRTMVQNWPFERIYNENPSQKNWTRQNFESVKSKSIRLIVCETANFKFWLFLLLCNDIFWFCISFRW